MGRLLTVIVFSTLIAGGNVTADSNFLYADCIVKIRSEIKDSKKQEIGTGFFWGSIEQIVTAYHVVKDSDEITVDYNGETTKDVVILSLSGIYDLAILKVTGLRKPKNFLPIDYNFKLPHQGLDTNTKLNVLGFPRSSFNVQHLSAKLTNYEAQDSMSFNDKEGKGIFKKSIDVISIEANIYGGVSGAPLLHGRIVVGIISGSLNEGGTLAWAIPVEYLASMEPYGKVPKAIDPWPRLALISEKYLKSLTLDNIRPGIDHYVDVYASKQFLDFNSAAIDFPTLDLNLSVYFAYSINIYKLSSWAAVELSLSLFDYSFSHQTMAGTEPTTTQALGILPMASFFFCYSLFHLQRTDFEPYVGIGVGACFIISLSGDDEVGAFSTIFPLIPQLRLGFDLFNSIFIELRVLFTYFTYKNVIFNNFGQGTLFSENDWKIRLNLVMGCRF